MNNTFKRNCVLKRQAIFIYKITAKKEKVDITHLAMEIDFQTCVHVVATEKE